jgi:phosphatidylglycerol:prolipoprotein diacylglycerol transferase
MRFCTEFVIEPDRFLAPLSLGLSMGQWLTLPMMLAGAVLLAWSMRQQNHPKRT